MNQPSSPTARASAVAALAAGLIALVAVVAIAFGGGETSGLRGLSPAGEVTRTKEDRKAPPARFYVVKSGDTLTSIAHRAGVPVVRIQRLNPDVDPQILIAGEKLKLR